MNDLAVSDINSHMARIADNITRLRLGVADPYARRPLLSEVLGTEIPKCL